MYVHKKWGMRMTYLALYREWRPQTFRDIVGQEHVTRTLRNAVQAGRTGHAYLFCGSRGTGKTTAAKVLAKALNCLDRNGPEPCNQCANCRSVTEGYATDVLEIDAASNRGIDEIRDLRERIKFAPAAGRFRVYIVDEVHMLTNEAFNALLKTLEEPPGHVVFILATTEPQKVPLTILSRCQRFDFKRIPIRDIIGRLKEVAAGAGIETDDEALLLIARAAEGGLRDALSILDQGAALGEMRVTAEDVHNILGTVRLDILSSMAGFLAAGDAGLALRLVGELTGMGKDLRLFAKEMSAFLRALILEKISPGGAWEETWGDALKAVPLAAGFSEERLLRAVEILLKAEQEMKWASLPGIVLELALVKACRPEIDADLTSLAARVAALEERLTVFSRPVAAEQRAAGPDVGSLLLNENLSENAAAAPDVSDCAEEAQLMAAFMPAEHLFPAGLNTQAALDSRGLKQTPAPAVVAATRKKKAGAHEPGPGLSFAPLEDLVVSRPTSAVSDADLQQEAEPEQEAEFKRVWSAWTEILDELRRDRPPLYPSFTKTAPLQVRDRNLLVGFPEGEELALRMAERPDNKKFLEELLSKFFSAEWQVSYKFYQGEIRLPVAPPERANDISRRFRGQEVSLADENELNSLFLQERLFDDEDS